VTHHLSPSPEQGEWSSEAELPPYPSSSQSTLDEYEPGILVCAATDFELDAYPAGDPGTTRLLLGVGIPVALSAIADRLWSTGEHRSPGLIVNVGIAGAYPGTGIEIGDIVLAEREGYGDVGFELPEPPGFRSINDSPFGEFYAKPFDASLPDGWYLPNPLGAKYRVHLGKGSTVNSCTGTDATGAARRRLTGAAFETMEGAAVAQVAQQHGIPFCEIRAVSNVAARRDMRPENIRLALAHLRHYLAACRRSF
jgi:futalosine hydrolase